MWNRISQYLFPQQSAETRREAGGSTCTAQTGSAILTPQFSGAQRDVQITSNVYYQHVPSHAEPKDTTADPPDNKEYIQKCQAELKSFLEKETMNLFQGTEEDEPTPLDKIYTELFITKGGGGEVNTEHEVIELGRKRCKETKINLNDIFQPLPNEHYPPQRVLTAGIAGIGKTVSVLKFTQDWARKEANHTTHFLFLFTFRELNLIKDEKWSVMTLIAHYFVEVKDLKASDYDGLKVLFIFDGLDESKLPLDFKNNKVCRSVTELTTVDVLLTNLITGKLMCKASVWITSRPAASARIPPNSIDRVTEVRGFNDEQKEEYFQKKVSDKDMAQKILDHLQSKPLRSLYIMCHIPVFCWISATVLQSLLTETHTGELPKSVTEMYTHFLIVQAKMTRKKNYEDREADKVMIMKLGKLAFEQLQEGNVIFDENHLKSCQIELTHAAVYSGVCTQIIKKECGLHKKEMYCFIHLSVQEFLAALYVLETFIDSGENLLPSQTDMKRKRKLPITFLHKKAVDMALANNKGQWDLFLRFLLGLSQDENQKLIQKVFGFKEGRPWNNEETINHIHEKIKKLSYADQSINLFHCLNELGDQSLVQQVQNYQSSGDVSKMLPAHWSALAYLLLVSNEDLDLFDLKKYCKSDDVLQRLLPVLKVSKIASLSDCKLAGRCCRLISSVLSLKSCCLEELDLSRNNLQDSGMRLLAYGLRSPNCKLQKLRLAGCRFSEVGCADLASSLRSNPAHLRVLDLSRNELQDAGVDHLSKFLPHCKLEKLSLKCCSLRADSCLHLALCCPSSLKELDLSYNQQTDRGVKLLCDWLRKPQCCLEILRLSEMTDSGCTSLASALTLNPSHLIELDLSKTDPLGSGVLHLSQIQRDDSYRLQTLMVTQ
ncbi:NLR family CARD domain-containing protein 3-like [Labrus mixtus]|uniref:NLR family CARD domain-containing protein 3-like n=1 Tax=Labrus mixtus TaxID=508554 RepID=UPI0029C0DBF4|nr:NLR family CARD domain-containing protein 3-like [Labrus mixtus]